MTHASYNIAALHEQQPTPEEKLMLDHFTTIESLVSLEEASALFRLGMMMSPRKRLLEIGSYRGGSTVALGHAAILKHHSMFCVDLWSEYNQQADFVNMDGNRLHDMTILAEFIQNTAFVKDRLCMMRGSASTFGDIMSNNLFALVFIDGAHDYFSVVDDIIFGLKVIEPGGILCGHDYHSMGVDVKRAVHDVVMNSETVANKGVIHNTSLWYAVIDDPAYELLIARTIREMARKDFDAAHRTLTEGLQGVRHTAEIERLCRGLEAELNSGQSRKGGNGEF